VLLEADSVGHFVAARIALEDFSENDLIGLLT
jgi:hypothetical protein